MVVRKIAWSDVIGLGSRIASRSRIRGDEAPRVRLGQSGADERVLDDPAKTLLLRQPTMDVPSQRHRERDAVENGRAISSTRSISRVTSRARQVGTVTFQSSRDVEAESDERRALLLGREVDPDHLRRPLGTEAHDGRLGQLAMDVRMPGHARTREVDEHPAREYRRGLGEVRVDALLPAIGSSRAEPEALGGAENPERLEVRCLEEHVRRRVRDLAVLAAHDRRERDRALAVRDEQVVRLEPAQRAVERAHLLTRACVPHCDAAVRELCAVERMKRAPPHVHHVVRHVDDVRDRAHLGEEQA